MYDAPVVEVLESEADLDKPIKDRLEVDMRDNVKNHNQQAQYYNYYIIAYCKRYI